MGAIGPNRNRVVDCSTARQTTQPGGIGSLELIFGLIKSLKIGALFPGAEVTFVDKVHYSKERKIQFLNQFSDLSCRNPPLSIVNS
jgi:hypothetical protein